MAISNGKFNGNIGGKSIMDYIVFGDYDNEDPTIEELEVEIEKRKKTICKLLNINEHGLSNDEFLQEIWDTGCCKSNINTKDILWSDTNVASRFESIGTYLLVPYMKIERINFKKNYSRPKKETTIEDKNISTEDNVNDKNYRLAPPEMIHRKTDKKNRYCSDFELRKIYSKDYNYYKDVLYPKIDKKLKHKIHKDLVSRYGHCDDKYEYTSYELKDYDTWNKIKQKEVNKIKFLEDAENNLDILKNQLESMKDGNVLLFNTYEKEGVRYFYKAKGEDGIITIPKREEVNRMIKLSKQLKMMGLDNSKMLELESKSYVNIDRTTNVNLNHITNNIKDINDYMIQVKLAHNNRVCINPDKCSPNKCVMDLIDYTNPKHIEALLYMPKKEHLEHDNDMSILSYDLHKMIDKLHNDRVLNTRDLYIIEGIGFNISQEQLAEELEVTQQNISSQINRIIRSITQGFKDEEEDLLYLNDLYGTYKKCSKCNNIKLIQRFNSNGKGGYRSECKECRH